MSKATEVGPEGSASHFWTNLFEQERLASRMDQIASEKGGLSCMLQGYGQVNCTVSKGTAERGGMLSEAFSVKAIVTNDGREGAMFTAFVKVIPNNPMMRAAAMTDNIYQREIGVYRNLHPTLRQLRSKAGADQNSIPLYAPEIYYTNYSKKPESKETTPGDQSKPSRSILCCLNRKAAKDSEEAVTQSQENVTDVLVMEDLRINGFEMAEKSTGSSFGQATLTLTAFANYHAMTIAFLRQLRTANGDYPLPKELAFLGEKFLIYDQMIGMLPLTVPVYAEAIKRLGHEEASQWLLEEMKNVIEIMGVEDVRQCHPLACILHGDCWNNNMMYRFHEGKPVEMRLIDWQIARLGHSATDVLHYIYSSLSPDVRKEHFQQLTSNYFQTLSSALMKLGINLKTEGYTEVEFHADIKKRSRWAMFMGLMVLPALHDPKMIAEVDNQDGIMNNFTGKAEDAFDEMKDKLSDMINVETVLKNPKLGQWMCQLIEEIKVAVQ